MIIKLSNYDYQCNDRAFKKQMDSTDPLSRSRCRERRLNNGRNHKCSWICR